VEGTQTAKKEAKPAAEGEGQTERIPSRERKREIRELPPKIPQVLCDKFGDTPSREFKLFEREFNSMCRFYSVPEDQKVTRFLFHLEGTVQEYVNCLIEVHEGPDLTYDRLIEELRTTYQRDMRPEEAQQKLQGRTWNIFAITIDEFTHDTRVLVQLAYPNERDLWDRKIKSFITLALPDTLARFLSVLGPVSVSDMTEWIKDNTHRIDLSREPDRLAENWVQRAYREWQVSRGEFRNTTEGDNNVGSVPYQSRSFPISVPRGLCFFCKLPGHRKAFCPELNGGPWRAGHHGQGT
ncbi:MAG: hypothetical protein GY820_30815, partial [Gammaproteobacteria bacterium]|nr:hypothetical protein [Gammaproteobacteria bacterium]